MDGGEVGAQVVSPVFFHKGGLPGAQFHDPQKKRSLPSGFHPAQPNPTGNWNPSSWNWDSVRFAARPVLDKQPPHSLNYSPANQSGSELNRGQVLTLELGGPVYSGGGERPSPGVTVAVPAAQEAAVRPNKRVRSGSPGSGSGGGGGGGYPKCQVDDCIANLSNAKDYHRRHKVCEAHSKTTKALVGNQMQRFCQQCSRFHPLSEFDEGKRSCRRRLAGHNRRRRKTQPTDVLPANQDGITNANLDIVNILTVLARLQGSNNNNNNGEKSASAAPMPDRDGLIQIISKINSLSGGTQQAAKSQPSGGGGFDLNNVSEETNPDSVEVEEQATVVNQNAAAPSTLNLLAVLSSAASLADPNKDSNSQGSSHSSSGKTNNNSKEKTSTNLGLQLFGSSLGGDESPPKVCSTTTKYLSSESSNPMEEQSPCASPPVVRKFFPIKSPSEHGAGAGAGDKAMRMCEDSTSQPFNMFKDPNANAVRNAVYPYPVAYANSSSGSDHSPSTSNSDAQDRTGRIVFKLFGKDPSSFPQNIRDQINKWLSSSPTSMESYIRPGCVVLCVYLCMPAFAWDQLEDNLLERVTSLVDCSDSGFWKNGRFLIRTNRQLLSHKDGMIRVSKSWRAWSSPEVTCVSPLAVVGGHKTSLLLRGRNLTVPGTKIYCTHMGNYLSKEVLCSAYPGTIYDDSSVERFDFPGDEPPFSLGRYFIEVENGFKGNSFPVIVASSPICEELRTLEAVFEITAGDENELYKSREEVLHFLNELGWLFQMERDTDRLLVFSVSRFKHLLIFSVERDWCVITKTLLDMLAKRSATDAEESLNTVQEVHLLNRAVRRKCRKMVHMLLHYTVYNNNNSHSKDIYLFIPSMAGPNGWTPLHLAASSDASEDIVDALTDDPQQIGLRCWDSVKDESEQTPEMYAAARGNHSYNELVMRKRADMLNGQVSICVNPENEITAMDRSYALEIRHKCGECAAMRARPQRKAGFIGRPYVLSMLGIAAVCVCVCVLMRDLIRINYGRSLNWEKLDRGFM